MSYLRTRLTVSLLLALSGPLLRAAVVATADNASPAGDGQTSLLEALNSLQDGETITFNIPGAGPHTILTPEDGYPLITRSGITIDGYSQPGAAPNTSAPDRPRDTRLRIVLDSRTVEPGERRLVIDFPGFGTSESCILGLMDAPNAAIRGLSFLNVAGYDKEHPARSGRHGSVRCRGHSPGILPGPGRRRSPVSPSGRVPVSTNYNRPSDSFSFSCSSPYFRPFAAPISPTTSIATPITPITTSIR